MFETQTQGCGFLKMIIDLKAHPAFAKREQAATITAVSDLEASFIKGFNANVILVERALQRFQDAPSPESLKAIVNTRIAVDNLIRNLAEEEENFAYSSESFLASYAEIKVKFQTLRDELDLAASSFVPEAPQPVQIIVNVQPKPLEQPWASRIIPVAILVAIGSIVMGAFL